MPEKPSLDGLEAKWAARWEEQRTYAFDRSRQRPQIYSIDTPPPTVSGSLHLGTVFGYVQVDALARYQRMRGREVFYPIGWDDNGLPTERRVQNYFGVVCDPAVPYEPGLTERIVSGGGAGGSGRHPISRASFVELCHVLTATDERGFEDVFRMVGLSVDWSLKYTTIDDRARRVAQRAFLHNVARGEAYAGEAPTLWDVDFRTAVAQAELEDREVPGAYHKLAFARPDGGAVEVETTRPELLPACVALVAHPDDARYRPLFGATVTTPVFRVAVPVLAHRLADPDKGTGIAMVCTFGDTTDVIWWREMDLPVRSVIGRDGRFARDTPGWLTGAGAAAYAAFAGRTVRQAQATVVGLLRESGELLGEPRPITHAVRYYEKGDRPLEIVTSRQWYIRNGARDPALREVMAERGRQIDWHPPFMRVRYEHWVEGLNTDWLISRQRYFGVPFPVWYPVGADGEPLWEQPIFPGEAMLPVDPQASAPPGYAEAQRGRPGGFVGDPDVMDTWATSSLTPQIASGWADDGDLFTRVYPMDMRPQGPEIIRTWLFSTVLRSEFEHGELPWRHACINGWILDPDRKKMSKSKGNVITPRQLIEEHGADGVRYWATSAGPGTDTAADPGQMKIGRRLANKILNASRFVLGLGEGTDGQGPDGSPGPAAAVGGLAPGAVTEPVDRAMLAGLAAVVAEATAALSAYQYHQALEVTEKFFWDFCADYLELVKVRAYGSGPGADSARAALAIGLDVQLRLFAPFVPFVTEEVWSWWRPGSVHREPWPDAADLTEVATGGDPAVLAVAAGVLAEVRKAKSTRKLSLRTQVLRLTIADEPGALAALRLAESDLRAAGVGTDLVLDEAAQRSVSVELAPAAS